MLQQLRVAPVRCNLTLDAHGQSFLHSANHVRVVFRTLRNFTPLRSLALHHLSCFPSRPDNTLRLLSQLVTGSLSLESLVLLDCQLNDEHGKALTQALTRAPQLTQLCLSHNDLGPDSVFSLAAVMQTRKVKLKYLDLRANPNITRSSDRQLAVQWSNVLRSRKGQVCSSLIEFSPSVRADFIRLMQEAESPNLRALCFSNCSMREPSDVSLLRDILMGPLAEHLYFLDLRFSFLNVCSRELIPLLEANDTLVHIDLRHCGLRDDGCRAMCTLLLRSNSLTSVCLQSNQITDRSLENLTECLQYAPVLSCLDLSRNELSAESFKPLLEAVEKNSSIVDLGDLSNMSFDVLSRGRLQTQLKRNRNRNITLASDPTFNTQYRELYRECSRLQSFTSKYREQYEDRAEEIKRLREDNESLNLALENIVSVLEETTSSKIRSTNLFVDIHAIVKSHFHRMEKPHVVESLAALLQSPSSSRKAGRRRPAGSGSAVSGRNPSPSRVATTTPTRSVSRNQHSSEVPGAPSTPTRGSKGKPPVPRGALRSSSPAGSRRVSSSRLRDPSPAHRRHDMSREIVEAASSGMAQHSTTRLDSPSPTFTAGPPSLDGSGSELEEKLLGSYSPLSADHREEAGSAASSLSANALPAAGLALMEDSTSSSSGNRLVHSGSALTRDDDGDASSQASRSSLSYEERFPALPESPCRDGSTPTVHDTAGRRETPGTPPSMGRPPRTRDAWGLSAERLGDTAEGEDLRPETLYRPRGGGPLRVRIRGHPQDPQQQPAHPLGSLDRAPRLKVPKSYSLRTLPNMEGVRRPSGGSSSTDEEGQGVQDHDEEDDLLFDV